MSGLGAMRQPKTDIEEGDWYGWLEEAARHVLKSGKQHLALGPSVRADVSMQ